MAAIEIKEIDSIEGILKQFQPSSWQPVSRTTHFANAKGESEIRMGHAGRTLQFRVVLHKKYDQGGITKAIEKIISSVNKSMSLKIDGWEEFKSCTLKAWLPIAGPLEDLAGTLDGGWWAEGILEFRQLSPEA